MPAEPTRDLAQLSATSSVEVGEDRLSIRLGTTCEGSDAASVQAALSRALDAALAEARSTARPGLLEPRSGGFSIGPRYGKEGRIEGWRGSVELNLDGSDFARISQTAARITTLTVSGIVFSLSREARLKAQTQAQTQAIAQFRERAHAIARGFGFSDYRLVEVHVVDNDAAPPRLMRTMAAAAPGADVPVEAGNSTVTVVVSGTVQMK